MFDVPARNEGHHPAKSSVGGARHVLKMVGTDRQEAVGLGAGKGPSAVDAAVHGALGKGAVAAVGRCGLEGRQGARRDAGLTAAQVPQNMRGATLQSGLQEYEIDCISSRQDAISSRQDGSRPADPKLRVVAPEDPPPRGGCRRALFQTFVYVQICIVCRKNLLNT